MLCTDFVRHYERDRASDPRISPAARQVLQPAIDWSMRFGRLLYDGLGGDLSEQDPLGMLGEYVAWGIQNLGRISAEAHKRALSEEDTLNIHTALHFHSLNGAMLPLWYQVLSDMPVGTERNREISVVQNDLAMNSLYAYISRQKEAGATASRRYFNQSNSERRKVVEGLLNEPDAAIVLLEASKKGGYHILPAPAQFESSKKPRHNVDFVAIRNPSQVVGIQVKTKATNEHIEGYDPDIVIIDADTDLGNRLATRTEASKSHIRVVSWAGIIAVHRVLRMNKQARAQIIRTRQLKERDLIALSMQIAQYAGAIKDMTDTAVRNVGIRVEAKFNEDLKEAPAAG